MTRAPPTLPAGHGGGLPGRLRSGALELRPMERLGAGGMGEVWRVEDLVHQRDLALKVAHATVAADPALRARFEREPRILSRLDHPGVVPLYASGELADGRPWYAMRCVEGETLGAHARRVREPRQVVGRFERVVETLRYAHDRGVLHLDLKPDNLMVGRFEEVLVMDWGAGRWMDEVLATRTGTPGFMPPEQQGDGETGPWSDVYALGATLQALFALAAAELPPELDRVAEACLAEDPASRPDTSALLEVLRAWVEQSRRRDAARGLVAGAGPFFEASARLRSEAAAHRARATALLAPLPSWAAEEELRPGWEALRLAAGLETEAEVAEVRHRLGLEEALRVDPGCDEAHDQLADLFHRRLLAAEARRDDPGAAAAREALGSHARGAKRGLLEEHGTVTLDSRPSGVPVRALRRLPGLGREEEEDHGIVGVTPLVDVRLPAGSWVLALGDRARLPVLLRRGERWEARRPVMPDADEAEDVPEPVLLPADDTETVGGDACYVPGGWTLVGGDAEAVDGVEEHRMWIDGFVMQRHPVTVRAWLAFLRALRDAGQDPSPWIPRATHGGGDGTPVFRAGDLDAPLAAVGVDGLPMREAEPVTQVSAFAAEAYAAWWSAVTDEPWRLPDEWEWERAARGAGGRRFPWGDRCAGAWTCMQRSHPGPPRKALIEEFPADVSVFGVRGLGGNVRDWTATSFAREAPRHRRWPTGTAAGDPRWRVSRGGSWISAAPFCLSAARFAGLPESWPAGVGVRLVKSVSSWSTKNASSSGRRGGSASQS